MARKAILVLALALPLIALTREAEAVPPEARGVVVALDRREPAVCVDVGDEEVWFFKGPSTVVTVGGYAAEFGDLKPGYRVALTYDAQTGEARRIDAER